MDKILINNLRIETHIGVLAWEQQVKQPLVFHVDIDYDCQPCTATDDLSLTLDYSAVAQQLTEFVQLQQCGLLETLAERSCQFILDNFKVPSVTIRIDKPAAIANASSASVQIQRQGTQ